MHIRTLLRDSLVLLCGTVMLAGCTLALRLPDPISTPISLAVPIEQPVTLIPLAGPASEARIEFSSMAWYDDVLVLLPQFPHRFDNQLFYLSKESIETFLQGNASPLVPQTVPLLGSEGAERLAGFEGFEALAFAGNRVYMTVEADTVDGMMGHLLTGEIAPDLSALTIHPELHATIPPQAQINNFSDEAIVLAGDSVLTFYEANGFLLNQDPVAHHFSQDTLEPLEPLPSVNLEYRLTDATPLDEAGRFWVINYFFPGDYHLDLGPDPLAVTYGAGPTHKQQKIVERLVELQYTQDGITRVDAPPIQLQLLDGVARNWEGIVRLETPGLSGFLLVTDRFPETLLAFVPHPEER